jgi:hypothetical protein
MNFLLPVFQYVVAAVVLLIPVAIVAIWPASWWFTVDTVHVNDSRVGEQITMLVKREAKRPFVGTYYVTVHKWTANGPEAYCRTQGGPWEYKKQSTYPPTLTFKWWTEDAPSCRGLNSAPGQYKVTTRWVIHGDWLFPNKSITVESNIFNVTP